MPATAMRRVGVKRDAFPIDLLRGGGKALRTTLWVVPLVLVLIGVGLFAVTYQLDQYAYRHHTTLPSWIRIESADGAAQLLSALAAGVITVLGVVFSVTIVALTLASQQFGPRMFRNFMRDLGKQVTLGVFVATVIYLILTLASIGSGDQSSTFVPQISVTVALFLVLMNILVLIYFIHHIAVSIQLPGVMSSIAANLAHAIDLQFPQAHKSDPKIFATGRSPGELTALLAAEGPPTSSQRIAATCSSSATSGWSASQPGTTPSSNCRTGRGTSSPTVCRWRGHRHQLGGDRFTAKAPRPTSPTQSVNSTMPSALATPFAGGRMCPRGRLLERSRGL